MYELYKGQEWIRAKGVIAKTSQVSDSAPGIPPGIGSCPKPAGPVAPGSGKHKPS